MLLDDHKMREIISAESKNDLYFLPRPTNFLENQNDQKHAILAPKEAIFLNFSLLENWYNFLFLREIISAESKNDLYFFPRSTNFLENQNDQKYAFFTPKETIF